MESKEIIFAFIRTLIALPLVVALAYVVIKYGLARRGLAQGGSSGGRRMRVVEQLPLGPKGLLSLVEVGGKYYLLAQTESGFTLLKEYDHLPDPLPEVNSPAGLPDFRQILKFNLKKGGHAKDTTEGDNGREK